MEKPHDAISTGEEGVLSRSRQAPCPHAAHYQAAATTDRGDKIFYHNLLDVDLSLIQNLCKRP